MEFSVPFFKSIDYFSVLTDIQELISKNLIFSLPLNIFGRIDFKATRSSGA